MLLRQPGKPLLFAGFSLCLLLPSGGVIQKYLGNLGLLIYLVLGSALLWVVYRYASGRFLSLISERQALYLGALTFVALIVIFALVYPKADAHTNGLGSDADDALNLAGHELLSGRYPFHVETYVGSPIGIFPGAVLLALPFILLGNSAPQNLFWLAAFFFALSRSVSSWRLSLLLLWTVLLFSPVVMQQVVTGTDDVANSIYVLLFMLLLVRWAASPDAAVWKKVLAALLLGIGLSSRANFVLVLPQLLSELTLRTNWSVAAKYLGIVCVAFATVTLPFWLYDPAGFSPFHNQAAQIGAFQSVLSYSGFAVPALGGFISMALAVQSLRRRRATWLRDCAIVQASLVFAVVMLSVVEQGAFSLVLIRYGVFFLFFGVYACYLKMFDAAGAEFAQIPSTQ